MPGHYPHTALKTLLIGSALWCAAADAITFNLPNRTNPRIQITVGDTQKKIISQVVFTVPPGQVGNGTPVTAATPVFIELLIRASGANPLTGFLTVNSIEKPLQNTDPGSSSSIPFSEVSWTSQDGNIPSGAFQGTIDQDIVSFQSSQGYSDYLTFTYANTLLIESGTYKGQVIYTWAVP